MNRVTTLVLLMVLPLVGIAGAQSIDALLGRALDKKNRPEGRLSIQRNRSSEPLMRREQVTPMDPDKIALDRVIDPATYVLGPGDRLAVSILGAVGITFEVVVTPDGQVVIPQVGAIKVAGRTLLKSKTRLAEAIGDAYGLTPMTVALLGVRQFRVYVSGSVVVPGAVRATPVERVSDVILSAGWLKPESSQRRIELHRGRRTIPVDLASFINTGSLAANPRVEMGDVVVVPLRQDSVAIYGGVATPGFYEWSPGDRVSTLIALAGGLRAEGRGTKVTVAKVLADTTDRTIRTIDLAKVMGGENDPSLGRDDWVLVEPQIPYHRPAIVTLKGEVRRPGDYPIVEGLTRLVDVLTSAGGLTGQADMESAEVLRPPPVDQPDPDTLRIEEFRRSELTGMEYAYLKARIRRSGPAAVRGFRSALRDPKDSAANIILQDGDIVNVPRRPTGVEVLGQVESPGILPYVPGMSWKEYVGSAGGMLSNADGFNIRVIKRSNGNWVSAGSTEIEPGDILFVPEDEEIKWWPMFRELVAVLGQVATILILVQTLR